MNAEVVGLNIISEGLAGTAGVVTLKTPHGGANYYCEPDEMKGLRIGQQVRLKLVRVRGKAGEEQAAKVDERQLSEQARNVAQQEKARAEADSRLKQRAGGALF